MVGRYRRDHQIAVIDLLPLRIVQIGVERVHPRIQWVEEPWPEQPAAARHLPDVSEPFRQPVLPRPVARGKYRTGFRDGHVVDVHYRHVPGR